ncbi:MAG: hypothetical protein KF901_12940 [Myxococcales bacterium]|nr:hypothetical protein [Myxococcales bacterium]
MPFARAISSVLVVLWGAGCASGDPRAGGRDAGTAEVDAAIEDAREELDAATLDAGPADASARDAGPGCTTETATSVCGVRPCVDGHCCDSACDGPCRSCAVPGFEGTCTSFAEGTDPEDECEAEAASTCGRTGTCDGAGRCALHGTSVACDDGQACTTGDACDGAGTCRGAAPAECAPAAGNQCCLGSCDATGGCVTEAGSCADVCGGARLEVGRTCQGCGGPRAAGSCLGGVQHVCDATSHSLCQQVTCGGTSYVCSNVGGVFAWRATLACDDGNPCTFGDACVGGACMGTSVSCASTTCMTRACNGTSTCTETPNVGVGCDDGDACTYGETCNAAGSCGGGSVVTCTSAPCLTRACNGTATCTESPRTGMSCDDGMACTFGSTCDVSGACVGGSPVSCPADTTCRMHTCNGTSTCTMTPRNVGGPCDDGDPATMGDRCLADGTCRGSVCPPTLTNAFTTDFASPSSSAWTSGTDTQVTTSPWRATTSSQHGVRINGGLLEITNRRGSSGPGHGQGYAMVRAGGAGSPFAAGYQPVLSANAGQEVVWSFNMRRDNPEGTNGGFSCSSSSSQNGITVGLAFVLATDSATGLNASASTCSASATARGYAVTMAGGRLRLVRFVNGLRNGTLTTLVESSSFTITNHFSVRVTFNAVTSQWRLEARSDGTSVFGNPAAGSYSFSGVAVDTTHVNVPLEYTGPYFQTGCSGLCSSTYTARFDNVSVGLRCAP